MSFIRNLGSSRIRKSQIFDEFYAENYGIQKGFSAAMGLFDYFHVFVGKKSTKPMLNFEVVRKMDSRIFQEMCSISNNPSFHPNVNIFSLRTRISTYLRDLKHEIEKEKT